MSESTPIAELTESTKPIDPAVEQALSALTAAQGSGKISESSLANIRRWLTEPGYAAYVPKILPFVQAGKFEELELAGCSGCGSPSNSRDAKALMTEPGSATMNERTGR